MNSDKQRAAIALYCGWKDVRGYMGIPPEGGTLFPYPEHHDEDWRLAPWRGLPDYLDDLNAMHEAEKYLSVEDSERYMNELQRSDDPDWSVCHSTAAQRAEAFLKTIGKWEE